ncbi:AAA family ATPase [Actinomadura roseirufa]|uniref:AAA family ATPase n=1 Tax=Actinomadura roseirufa TaxID=2094049 RepID=UPI001041B729|nr:ATP-binding protein [Actinomadura roseirufa]
MYISRLRLTNVKGFTGPRVVDLDLTRPDGSYAGWTVLAGRNGSGKTTILRAIALTFLGSSGTVFEEDMAQWVSAGTEEGRAQLTVIPPHDGHVLFNFEEGLEWGWRWSSVPGEGGAIGISSGPLPDQRHLFPPDVRRRRGEPAWLCIGYGPFRRPEKHSLGSRWRIKGEEVGRVVSLFREDAVLEEGISWLIRAHLRTLERKVDAEVILDSALRILSDGLLPDSYKIGKVDSDGLWVTKGDRRFPLREMSDGYRTITALVLDLLIQIRFAFNNLPFAVTEAGVPIVTAPGVVLIDEVEAHLHISWQKRIGSWLKQHFPQIQFIVTTHSPYICQEADPGGLIRLPGPDEEAAPERVSDDLYERVVYGSGDDAVLTELFGLDSTYSEAAQRLRRYLVKLEAKVIEGSANEREISRYQELRDQLTSSAATRVGEVAAALRLPKDPTDQ